MDKENNINFNEADIRPKDLLDGQNAAVQSDIDFLLQHRNAFVEVNCPACNSTNSEFVFEKKGISYKNCTDCSTMFVSPRPDENILSEFYRQSKNYEYWNTYIFPASEETRKKKIFVPRVERAIDLCNKYNAGKNLLLEVGAGFGTFCSLLNEKKVFNKVIGVEPTPSLADTCRKKGIEIIDKPIEEIDEIKKNTVDVIANFEVIEHLFSPDNFIRTCYELLAPDGIMITTCPNGKGFDVITLGTLSNTIDHEHLNYFNPDSLSALLEKNGFQVLEVLTPGILDADIVRNSVLEGKFDLSKQPFLKTILIDKWNEMGKPFQQFLIDNHLSSNMWIVAKKIAR